MCRLFAPVYRSLTLLAIGGGIPGRPGRGQDLAYGDVVDAATYADELNDGRSVVLIGTRRGGILRSSWRWRSGADPPASSGSSRPCSSGRRSASLPTALRARPRRPAASSRTRRTSGRPPPAEAPCSATQTGPATRRSGRPGGRQRPRRRRPARQGDAPRGRRGLRRTRHALRRPAGRSPRRAPRSAATGSCRRPPGTEDSRPVDRLLCRAAGADLGPPPARRQPRRRTTSSRW